MQMKNAFLVLLAAALLALPAMAQVKVTSAGDKVAVEINGKPFTTFYMSGEAFNAMAANVQAAYGFFGAGAAPAGAAAVQAAGLAALDKCVLSLHGVWGTNCMGDHVFDNEHTYHGVLDMKWDITGDLSLRSITGVHSFYDINAFDLDAP